MTRTTKPKPVYKPRADTLAIKASAQDAHDLRAIAGMVGIRTRDALAICLNAWRGLDDAARLKLLRPYMRIDESGTSDRDG